MSMTSIEVEKKVKEAYLDCLDDDLKELYKTKPGAGWAQALCEIQTMRNQVTLEGALLDLTLELKTSKKGK